MVNKILKLGKLTFKGFTLVNSKNTFSMYSPMLTENAFLRKIKPGDGQYSNPLTLAQDTAMKSPIQPSNFHNFKTRVFYPSSLYNPAIIPQKAFVVRSISVWQIPTRMKSWLIHPPSFATPEFKIIFQPINLVPRLPNTSEPYPYPEARAITRPTLTSKQTFFMEEACIVEKKYEAKEC